MASTADRINKLREVEELVNNISGLRKRLEEKRRLIPERYRGLSIDELARLVENLDGLGELAERYESLLKSLEDARRVRDEVRRLREELEAVTGGRTIDHLYDEASRLAGAISGKEGEKKQLNRAMDELRGAVGKCPVCGSELTDEHRERLLKEYEERIRELDREIAQLRSQLNSLNTRLKKAKKLDRSLGMKEGEYNERIRRIAGEYGEVIREALHEQVEG